MAMGMPYGLQSMLKEGHKHLSGLEEAVIKNIEACKQLSKITRTSLGPNGMNKMVINHLEKLFVTSDAAVILQEMEVQHPAAKLLVMAAKAQESEIGDGTNLVVTLAGELLGNAEELLRDGLHPSEVIEGYSKSTAKVLDMLEQLVIPGSEKLDVRSVDAVAARLRGALASKQYGCEGILAPLIAKACVDVTPAKAANFNVDNVRVAKIVGGGLRDSFVIQGLVLVRDAEGTIKEAANAKVAVFGCALDTSGTETKGTVLIESAAQLEGYAKGEEAKMEEAIAAIAATGAKVVVSGQSVGEMALHFAERYGLMCIKIPSKFELRRFCRATGATALVQLGAPLPSELGLAASLRAEEIGGTRVLVLKQAEHQGTLSTLVMRAPTEQILDDLERAVDDGVNCYKTLVKDARMLPAGGATEIELARRLAVVAHKETGLDQYAIGKFATSLEVVPRTLAENAGLHASDVLSALYAAHAAGQVTVGVDVETGGVKDLSVDNIQDLFSTKWWAIKLAADAVTTVLRVDQIIMSRQAGGPKPGGGPGGGDDD